MKTMMKTLIAVLAGLLMQFSLSAQPAGNYGYSNDISENLDMEAVANVFANAKNLNDFEKKLNNPRNAVSNLDLNNDGFVDFLRVSKRTVDNVDYIYIQAVLGGNIFQNVVTVIVERYRFRNDMILFVGDPYLYGEDYVIEPQFSWNPPILRWLWRNAGNDWYSPYDWGYYPNYYYGYSPLELRIYMGNMRMHIHPYHRFYYDYDIHNSNYYNHYWKYRRNDWGDRHPENRFDYRNKDKKNSLDLSPNNDAVRRRDAGAGSRPTNQNPNQIDRQNPVNQQNNGVRRNENQNGSNQGIQRRNENMQQRDQNMQQRNENNQQRNQNIQQRNENNQQRNENIQQRNENNQQRNENIQQRNENNSRRNENNLGDENRVQPQNRNQFERPNKPDVVAPAQERSRPVVTPERKEEQRPAVRTESQPVRTREVTREPERRQEVKQERVAPVKSENIRQKESDDSNKGRR